MNDSIESKPQEGGSPRRRWLLFIHHIPPKPDYLRVKVRRRLQRIGAVALKNSVYVLPDIDEPREDLEWLMREVVTDGGDATICSAELLEGTTDTDLEAAFRRERDAEYAEIERDAATGVAAERLRTRLEAVMRNDFFAAPGRAAAERAVAGGTTSGEQQQLGQVWVTRRGVFVDRMASAWLIHRFIDAAARFKFVADRHYRPGPGEQRFDMFGGEYTHEGDRCTFETILARFELTDPALGAIGQIVHDIDLKEDRYARKETAGIESVLRGITLETANDTERLERSAPVFDGLYARLTAHA
jgi:hypothetical protein